MVSRICCGGTIDDDDDVQQPVVVVTPKRPKSWVRLKLKGGREQPFRVCDHRLGRSPKLGCPCAATHAACRWPARMIGMMPTFKSYSTVSARTTKQEKTHQPCGPLIGTGPPEVEVEGDLDRSVKLEGRTPGKRTLLFA